MSTGERARTVIKTVWPIELVFSSSEDRSPEEPQSNQDEGTQDTPHPSEFPEISDQGITLLVPTPLVLHPHPCTSNTASSPPDDPGIPRTNSFRCHQQHHNKSLGKCRKSGQPHVQQVPTCSWSYPLGTCVSSRNRRSRKGQLQVHVPSLLESFTTLSIQGVRDS